MKLLHIEASPRADSFSSRAAHAFLAALPAERVIIDRLNVWREDLPPFDGETLAAKYARLRGASFTTAQARAWEAIETLVSRLDAADIILLSTPMWNLSLPYRLKHYIDLVTQPGLTFRFDPAAGYFPLLRDRPVIAAMATSGDFSEGPSYGRPDFASPYLAQALRFIGLADLRLVLVGPTAGDPARVQAGEHRARDALRSHAARLMEAVS